VQYIEPSPPLFVNVVGEFSPWSPPGEDPGMDRLRGLIGVTAHHKVRPILQLGDGAAELISLIHRDHRDAVVFGRKKTPEEMLAEPPGKKPKDFKQLFEVRACEVSELLPGFAQHLTLDAYQSLSGFGMARGYNARPNRFGIKRRNGAPLAYGDRTKSNASMLTAVWVDLDCHSIGVDPHTAIAKARELVGRGELPMWSIELFSGRGAWLIWLLGQEGTQRTAVRTKSGQLSAGMPIPLKGPGGHAERDRMRVWEACIKTLTTRLAALNVGVDSSAAEPTRIARVAGSLNSKSGEEVYYAVYRRGSDRLPACYSLQELTALLQVEVPEQRKRKPRAAVSPERSAAAKHAQLIGNRKRWEKLIRLAELRRGVREGERGGNFMSIAAQLGRLVFDREGNKKTRPELLAELRAFNANHCRPPFDDTEVVSWHRHQCNRARRGGDPIMNVIRDATIAEDLLITREEAQLIGWRYAGQIDEPKPTTPRVRAAHRRELLRAWVIDHRGGEVPTAREAGEWLERTTGDRPSLSMLKVDLRELFGGARQDDRQVPNDPR
jgi:hypothetical protein